MCILEAFSPYVLKMEENNVRFTTSDSSSSNNMNRVVLPKMEEDANRRKSMTASETFSLVTSGSSPFSPDIDSDLEEMALQGDHDEGIAEYDEQREQLNGGTEGDEKKRFMSCETEIRQKAKAALTKELRRVRRQAAAKKTEIRKKFKVVIDDARSQLIASRIEADKASIDKLEEKAEIQQAKILQERAQRIKEGKKEYEYDRSRAHSTELGLLRKIQADLDRARARRKQSLAAVLKTVNGKAKVANLLQYEVRRLERAEEVQKIIVELYELELTQAAKNLTRSLRAKEEFEIRLRAQLNDEQVKAKKRAMLLVEDEIKKVRKEYEEEQRRKEQERLEKERLKKEQEEKERREREMAKIKKMARDLAMRKMFKQSMLNTSLSRPFSFSYFPTLKK